MYFQNIGHGDEINSEEVDWLEVDDEYLREAFDIFESYSNELWRLFHEKYGRKSRRRKPKAKTM